MIALVPTCNRPELFARLVSRLEHFQVIGFVNNTTPENLMKYIALDLPVNVRLIFTDIGGEPKACHVETFRLMLQYANEECLIIEDDIVPCPHFYYALLNRIDILKTVRPRHPGHPEFISGSFSGSLPTETATANFTLSPIYLPNRNSDFYTGAVSHPVKFDVFNFIDQAWVDGNFYMTSGVLAAMKEWLKDPVTIFRSSSGIGRKNSHEIHRRGWKMYTSVPTLVEHLDQDSVMFGERRKQVPLIAHFDTPSATQ